MTQEIIVLTIIAAAAGIAIYRLVRFVFHPFSKCESCSMNCTGCALDELKKEIGKEKKSKANLLHD